MNNHFQDINDELLEFPELAEIIHLDSEQTEQAWQITKQLKADKGKLQIYSQALALVAFEEWLSKREPNLLIDRRKISLLHPESAEAINAVCNLQVGNFKVCLIPTFSFSDEIITLPQTIIDVPEFAAHFYIVIGVEDELEVAAIRGFSRYDELVSMTAKMPILSDASYEINLAAFHQQTNELLLYLQCLSPADIQLPAISVNRKDYLKDLMQILTQKAVNTGLWIQNQLDEVAQELSWQLLPAPSMRRTQTTPSEELDGILTEIDDVEIPSNAARSYRDIELAGIKLRLYALTWLLLSTEGDWSLLLILGAIPGNKPPLGVKLRISNLTKVLDKQVLQPDDNYNHLYIQIAGSKKEKFLVTVTSDDGKDEISVLFEFRPE
ncbi:MULTISPECIES: DUF1822 family protein [unclassified Tolypothrix]|uniref:DUF1822 family protein n=1 Tax=unclassified Tolypothrix TaxID=2649714 RepID=UPI0005EAC73E|nr:MULTISPECIES: DUF1822 family protein [unclassified Tolypothrix]BAY95706.1 hypothetical protein NIES3275_77830 [Microchaete diplosiphon NIES-3275]EKE97306.1 hypothetical protein FDUTEX481_05244 [Tolypothrix sp. PCC 7601]MBE9082321.1 DUF1822 family protein [Tolypothrix sp. LEGE 11397]UYD30735.1 DUF1822 family protein [Tolypothrix sp. PCC 7712]UYD38669.1 DUF1822 family protein [Tolypothrix sp. PCC 7601]